MRKIIGIGSLLLALSACATPDRATLPPPLPDKVTALPYGQLLERARSQTARANEAFFIDNWQGVEEAARGLEQTAQYLAKAEDVPSKHKDTLVTQAGDLGKLAKALRESAAVKDEKKINEVFPKLQVKVREMRLGD